MLTSETVYRSKDFDVAAQQICTVSHFLAQKNWAPATSSNYSVKLSDQFIAITHTGVDKFKTELKDIIVIDRSGQVVSSKDHKASAETLIHTAIYNIKPSAGAVLHTHTAYNTRLSLKYASEGKIHFIGYEMQKGISGRKTHEQLEVLPILKNAQDMTVFSKDVISFLEENSTAQGFLIAGHGLYTWGKNIHEAQRHIETYEFLLECKALELMGV